MDFEAMMRQMAQAKRSAGDDEETDEPYIAVDIEALRLQDALSSFKTVNTFHVGQIVRQKPGVRCYRKHGRNDLSIVVKILDEPVMFEGDQENNNSASPYWKQLLDMQVGHIDGDNFVIFHVDSRRFEPVPEEEVRLRVRGLPETPR